jgi:hypothetical protein
MEENYVNMQENYVNMQVTNALGKSDKSHVVIIMLHLASMIFFFQSRSFFLIKRHVCLNWMLDCLYIESNRSIIINRFENLH